MAHVMKHTRDGCGHMLAHYERSAENISNINLDRSRTHLNYNLAVHQEMNQWQFIKKRCSEVRCQNRKDVNVMVSWVVTAPKDLPDFEYENFFQATYDFLENRYGKKNVISAYVHMDEVTPHMHFAFVPVVPDRKKGIEKVCAKEVISRKELKCFHEALESHINEKIPFRVSILNEATKNGNKAILELQRGTAIEKIEEIKEKIEILDQKHLEALSDMLDLFQLKEDLEKQIQEGENYLKQLEDLANVKESVMLRKIDELEQFKQFVLERYSELDIEKDYAAFHQKQIIQRKPLKHIKGF